MGGVVSSVFGGAPKAPKAPDPATLIQAQAQANRINEVNPFSSSTYSFTPNATTQAAQPNYGSGMLGSVANKLVGSQTPAAGTDGTWTRTIAYNPQIQGAIDQQLGQITGNMANGLDFSGAPQMATSLNVGGAKTGNAAKATGGIQTKLAKPVGQIQTSIDPNEFDINSYFQKVYDPMQQLLSKEYDRSGSALNSQLAAQGLQLGSEGFQNAQNIQSEGYNDALVRALSGAYGQALGASQNAFGQELAAGQFANSAQNQSFGQNLASGQFANSAQQQNYAQQYGLDQLAQGNRAQDIAVAQANANLANQGRQQAISEQLLQYQLPQQNLSYLAGLGGNFGATPNIDAMGAYGLSSGIANNNYNAAMQNYQGNLSGLFGLGGVLGAAKIMGPLAAACDPDLKTDIEPAPEVLPMLDRLRLSTFRYRVEPTEARHIGPMADEWAEIFGGDGKSISFVSLFGILLKSIQELNTKIEKLEASHV